MVTVFILVPQQFINRYTNGAMLELVFGDISNMVSKN
jgi:hypothetical protein